ncbi:MAG: 3-phosphoshikimate 1-carboxyvinyltransferase [Chloroflexi bacterium]|nr:3-phosphoshikimate 1-carboxyvinyltransferase [Chloroflexota bacterium]
MAREVSRPQRLRGSIEIPGDKSISHRAVMFNAVADGSATVTNFSGGADCTSTIGILRAMGVEIERTPGPAGRGDTVHISGVGMHGLTEPEEILDAGNSGTTTRLMSGLLAGRPFLSIITGDESLRSRPMGRVIEPLLSMGAEITARAGGLAPIVFHGGELRGIEYEMPVASAQLKSCLLLAGLRANGDTVIKQPNASRDHTERMLAGMGADIEVNGLDVAVSESTLTAADVEVPGDVSSAAFWIVAGAAHPDADITLYNVGVNPTRTGIFEVLRAMGANIDLVNQRTVAGEPVADLRVRSSALKGVDIGGDVVPLMIDEIPVVAVAAAMAEGTTRITEARELRVKESDRISATAAWLNAAGVQYEEAEDGLTIHGAGRLRPTVADSFGDHRIAMALAIAGLVSDGTIGIERAESVDISYPTFWRDLDTLSGAIA